MTANRSPLTSSSIARSLIALPGHAAVHPRWLHLAVAEERALTPAEARIERRRARLALCHELLRRAEAGRP
jgi:hypothetical protein